GVYTIIGATVGPGEIEAKVRISRPKHRVIQDYGWSSDGKSVWASYRLSNAMLRSGVVGVPGGIRKYVPTDPYELCGRDGSSIGSVHFSQGNMWGLLPFFRRRGGEPGDYMRVTFHLGDRKA